MTISIRRSVRADAEAIAKIQVETWRAAYAGIIPQDYLDAMNVEERAQDWAKQILESDADILVAENSEQVVGFINSGPIRDDAKIAELGYDAEIHTLYVPPRLQGAGIGRALMHAAAKRMVERGLSRPVVWALTENPWCRFYERLGARALAEKTIYIGGAPLSDTAFGWEHVSDLVTATA